MCKRMEKVNTMTIKTKRNGICSCGSGKKYKKCCLLSLKKSCCNSFSLGFLVPYKHESSILKKKEMKYKECRVCVHVRSSGSCRLGV